MILILKTIESCWSQGLFTGKVCQITSIIKVEFLLMNSGHVMHLLHSALAATVLEFLIPLINCFVWWFSMYLVQNHGCISSGKFQDAECFRISCPCHVSSLLLYMICPFLLSDWLLCCRVQ
jgi:uncharacterized membrane protein